MSLRSHHAVAHRYLGDLVAEFIKETRTLPAEASVTQLLQWSYRRAQVDGPYDLSSVGRNNERVPA